LLLPVARAAAIVAHGAAAEHVEPLPLGETNAPAGSGPMHEALLQGKNPWLQANPHWLPLHVGCAFATAVLQALPQELQFFASFVVSVHVPLHRADVGAVQPVAQA
jgi:hypothetical protein